VAVYEYLRTAGTLQFTQLHEHTSVSRRWSAQVYY